MPRSAPTVGHVGLVVRDMDRMRDFLRARGWAARDPDRDDRGQAHRRPDRAIRRQARSRIPGHGGASRSLGAAQVPPSPRRKSRPWTIGRRTQSRAVRGGRAGPHRRGAARGGARRVGAARCTGPAFGAACSTPRTRTATWWSSTSGSPTCDTRETDRQIRAATRAAPTTRNPGRPSNPRFRVGAPLVGAREHSGSGGPRCAIRWPTLRAAWARPFSWRDL